jgi:hypothetical protein
MPSYRYRYQYAVKFVLGKSDGRMLVPGNYSTAINVHNPHYKPVDFWKKVALAFPDQEPGPVSGFVPARLGPDEAFDIDEGDVRRIVGPEAPPIKGFVTGFVVIQSLEELDVVAVYTAGSGREVTTLALERVPARSIRGTIQRIAPISAKRWKKLRQR